MACVRSFRLRHLSTIVVRMTSRGVAKPRSWAQGVAGSNQAAQTNNISTVLIFGVIKFLSWVQRGCNRRLSAVPTGFLYSRG
jgi:hypothetical protein